MKDVITEECHGYIDDKGECLPIFSPQPKIQSPPNGKFNATVLKILDYLDEGDEPDHFAILKVRDIVFCKTCFSGEYHKKFEKYKPKEDDEILFYFHHTTKPISHKYPNLPGINIGDEIEVKFFGGIKKHPVKIPNTDLIYVWDIFEYEIIN